MTAQRHRYKRDSGTSQQFSYASLAIADDAVSGAPASENFYIIETLKAHARDTN